MGNRTQKDEKRYHALAKQIFRTEIEKLLETNDFDEEEVIGSFHYTEKELKKRVLASMRFAFEAMDRFNKYEQDEVFAQVITYCAKPLAAYDYIHQIHSTEQAFAIWALDILREEDKVEELYDLLPKEYAYSGAVACIVGYSESLLNKLAYVCENKDKETKETFEKILSLLPTEELERAESYFEGMLWALMDIYIPVAMDNLSKMDSLMAQVEQAKKNTLSVGLNLMGDLKVDQAEIERLLEEMNIYYAIEDANGMCMVDFGAVKPELIRKNFKQFARKEMFDFHIEDPYSICAMYHIHQFRRDDRFWVMGPMLSLLEMATLRLPWSAPLDFNEETKDKKDVGGESYRLQYKSEDFDLCTDSNRLMNEAQIVYHLTQGAIMPRKLKAFDAVRLILESQGASKEQINSILNYANAYSSLADLKDDDFAELDIEELLDYKDDQDIDEQDIQAPVESLSDTQSEQKPDYLAELERVKQENKRLRGEVHHFERLLQKEHEKFKAQNEQYKREHAELVDLRNIIFKQETGENISEPDSKLAIEYPYTTKKNICVFGGHDSWRKVIKPMFTNVRFIHKDTIPNVDLIKNSDMIWIQPNSLAHAYYYSIIDIVRTHNIPVRYFSYASAAKCAEQLVLGDLD